MKKAIYTLIFILVAVPTIASASWWNPFSWGKKPAPVVEQKVETQTVMSEEVISPEPKVIEKTVDRIVEKPVIKTQTITVTDPALQIKIDALVAENNDLKAQVARLLSLNKKLAEGNNSSPSTASVNAGCLDAKEEVVVINKQLATLQTKYEEDRKILDSDPWSTAQGKYIALDNKYYSSRNLISPKLGVAQAEVQKYCD